MDPARNGADRRRCRPGRQIWRRTSAADSRTTAAGGKNTGPVEEEEKEKAAQPGQGRGAVHLSWFMDPDPDQGIHFHR